MLVPALLGLKGNLEMTLASRLSTQVRIESFFSDFLVKFLIKLAFKVNLGQIHDKHTIKRSVLGNFAITQVKLCQNQVQDSHNVYISVNFLAPVNYCGISSIVCRVCSRVHTGAKVQASSFAYSNRQQCDYRFSG